MIVFVAGSRQIKQLDPVICDKLNHIMDQNAVVLVGDASGADTLVQRFFFEHDYRNVEVFACEGKARNNLGNWSVRTVPADKKVKGFEYYKIKDEAMAQIADYGLMIWDGKSRGTLNNVLNLVALGKKAFVYFAPRRTYYQVDKPEGVEGFAKLGGEQAYAHYKHLSNSGHPTQQLSFLGK